MNTSSPHLVRRIVALIAVLLNVAFNYAYPRLPLGLPDMKTASDRYANLFTPAPYAFSIWGAIYLSWIVYSILALLPSRRGQPLYDRTAGILILLNVLGTLWILEFVPGNVGVAQILILAMGLFGWMGFRRAEEHANTYWGVLPFSSFLGWITVANLANLAAWLTQQNVWSDIPWAPVFLGVAVAAAVLVGFLHREPVHPLVVAWATLAIGVKTQGVEARVAVPAFAAAGVCALVAAVSAWRRFKPA